MLWTMNPYTYKRCSRGINTWDTPTDGVVLSIDIQRHLLVYLTY
jgi:hypothetical protein